jgi:uncharacterized protein
MADFPLDDPLSEAELDYLQEFLDDSPEAMNIEEMDGFFCALVAGPDVVPPSEYLPEILGDAPFENPEETNKVLSLLMRHWNGIARTLAKGDVYIPLLLEDEDGMLAGNDWAIGFIEGIRLRMEAWTTLLDDDDHAGCLVPMLMLYHEHDNDPSLRPKPIGPKQREKVIAGMAAGLIFAYRYFREARKDAEHIAPAMARQSPRKIGRNAPCPCGSGKKYKRCCGGATIQ